MFNRQQLNKLYQYSFVLTSDEQEAYDLLHTSIEKFLNIDISKVQDTQAYVKKIIRNQYIDQCKKQSRYIEEEFDESVTYVDLDVNSLEKIAASRQQIDLVWRKLTASEREIVYFWAVEGYTTSELAKLLDISRGTLLSKIFRLRKRLEQEFKELSWDEVI